MIIGITGTFASGKDTVAEYLVSKGFQHISTGDLVTLDKFIAQEEAEKRGDKNQQQISEVMKLADITLENDGTIHDLHRKVEEALGRFDKRSSPN